MKKLRIILLIVFIVTVMTSTSFADSLKTESGSDLTQNEINKIEKIIDKQMKDGKIPGVAVAITKGDKTVYMKGFGYANVEKKLHVTTNTLFELGSTSKAFTGLGILKLESEGLIKLSNPVVKYIPWLKMKFKGKQVDITLEQFLHHTSGIPFSTIGKIEASNSNDSLERAVKTLVGVKLLDNPGETFSYASINYDVLGLVIERVTGKSFEAYIKDEVIKPLGLNNTVVTRQEALTEIALGYKIGFTRAIKYDAPIFRGNAPAGYIITNVEDMSKWLKIQVGLGSITPLYKRLVQASHNPDRTVMPSANGASYACGWYVMQDGGGQLSHDGSNPNFSSSIAFRPKEKLGVAVLANLNSINTTNINQDIMNIITGKALGKSEEDMYRNWDSFATVAILVMLTIILITLYFIVVALIEVLRRKRSFKSPNFRKIIKLIFNALITLFLGYCLYRLPDIYFQGLKWGFLEVWAPSSLLLAVKGIFVTAALLCLYYFLLSFSPKPNERHFFPLVILSIASGVGNAFIIFIINEALLGGDENFRNGLFLYFIFGIIIYVYGQKLIRFKLINITNDIVYSKRMELIDKIFNSLYQNVEAIENGKIQAGLNNDTEVISNFANVFITGLTSLVTLLACFIYLGIINFYGFLASAFVIILAAALYFIVGRVANRLLEQNRDIQNAFFRFIHGIVGGFKELSLNRLKRKELREDINQSCFAYSDKRKQVETKFTNVFLIGELLFTFVIGIVAFVFPVVFKDIYIMSLRNFVFVFLYMTGPVRALLNAIPDVFRMRVSWNRINALMKEITLLKGQLEENEVLPRTYGNVKLELKEVMFEYKIEDGKSFKVGPINYVFNSSEITFITGGNGSGKSTLAKLITGLYKPDSGEILLNDTQIVTGNLGEQYSAIFSDFYIFNKLYGVDYQGKENEIEELLKLLHIDNKVQLKDGVFSTIKLSTGQRKRLALLVSYLEDRPIYLFDEWAADQDPEFRQYFYNTLIPELKKRGKCVIAITHDDRYFGLADNIMKLDMGNIIEQKELKKYAAISLLSTNL